MSHRSLAVHSVARSFCLRGRWVWHRGLKFSWFEFIRLSMFIHCGGKTHFSETIVDPLWPVQQSQLARNDSRNSASWTMTFKRRRRYHSSQNVMFNFSFVGSCFTSTFLSFWVAFAFLVLLITDSTPFETLQSKMDELEKKQDPQRRILLSRSVTSSPSQGLPTFSLGESAGQYFGHFSVSWF